MEPLLLRWDNSRKVYRLLLLYWVPEEKGWSPVSAWAGMVFPYRVHRLDLARWDHGIVRKANRALWLRSNRRRKAWWWKMSRSTCK